MTTFNVTKLYYTSDEYNYYEVKSPKQVATVDADSLAELKSEIKRQKLAKNATWRYWKRGKFGEASYYLDSKDYKPLLRVEPVASMTSGSSDDTAMWVVGGLVVLVVAGIIYSKSQSAPTGP